MKLHHAATLACSVVLMGWILVMPPWVCDCPVPEHGRAACGVGERSPARTDPSAPLNKWRQCDKYPSRDACEDQLNIPPSQTRLYGVEEGPCPLHEEGTEEGECVPEGDPRLVR
jgi:hypothetical protein